MNLGQETIIGQLADQLETLAEFCLWVLIPSLSTSTTVRR
jgi:hypothetical protein